MCVARQQWSLPWHQNRVQFNIDDGDICVLLNKSFSSLRQIVKKAIEIETPVSLWLMHSVNMTHSIGQNNF
jgi:hypothetical protein